MGNYVNAYAKSGSADQINMLWKNQFPNSSPDFLIYTTEIIKDEIARIQEGAYPELAHLKSYVRSVSEWNKTFPIMAEGRGQIFIGWGESLSISEVENLKAQVQFLLDNRFLFEKIVGLDDAKEELGMSGIQGQKLVNGRYHSDELLTFDGMPYQPNNDIYNLCREYDRPGLWKAFADFKNQPDMNNWKELRQKVVPWAQGKFTTVWQLCEQQASRVDRKSYGISGKYQKQIPTEFEIVRALETQALELTDDSSASAPFF